MTSRTPDSRYHQLLEEARKRIVTDALYLHGGRVRETAAYLGFTQVGMHHTIVRLGIDLQAIRRDCRKKRQPVATQRPRLTGWLGRVGAKREDP